MSQEEGVHVTLSDLTPQQVQMLNKIWSFESGYELEVFRDTLPRFRQQELDTLVIMIIMEIEGKRAEEDVSQAQEMLRDLGYSV
jgi:hypothetical protein